MKNLHRPVVSIFCAVFSVLLLSLGSQASADEPAGPPAGLGMAWVTMAQGDTSFNSVDTDEWAALPVNFSLRDGDRLWAGDGSKIEVQFMGGQMAWLSYQTELDINKLESDNSRAIQVALATGEASFATRRMGPDDVFQVDTPNASVRAYDRARFRVSVLGDGGAQVGVSSGQVELETQNGISDVNPGELAEVTPDGQVNIGGLPPRDSWDDWVDSRWDLYSRPSESTRYLPPDMADYSYEFDNGGRWAYTPDYGEVWVPVVSPDWSPYSNGRWVWVAGNYVWLPYDPWYAPFHYGRWSWSVSVGWFWLPPAVSVGAWWSPGYVGWSWGAGAVSWVPLGPREIYYGYGYYGPMSVNLNVTHVTVVKNVYVNSRARNGVVMVNRNNFLKGDIRRMRIAKGQDPFRHRGAMGQRVMPGPPARAIKPIKDTRLPRPGVRPKAVPPRQLQRALPMLRQRTIARKKGRSAFTPGKTPPRVPREMGGRAPKQGAPAAPGFRPGRQEMPGGIERRQPESRPGEVNVPGGRPGTGGMERGRKAAPGMERQRVAPEGMAPENVRPGAPFGERGQMGRPEAGRPARPQKPEKRPGRPKEEKKKERPREEEGR